MNEAKIVLAANSMIQNERNIWDVTKGAHANEVFFSYPGESKKHKWSIFKDEQGVYYLHYYTGQESLETLATWPDEEWEGYSGMVSYNTKELNAQEARESFRELFSVVTSKLFGMDEILDEIIDDMMPF